MMPGNCPINKRKPLSARCDFAMGPPFSCERAKGFDAFLFANGVNLSLKSKNFETEETMPEPHNFLSRSDRLVSRRPPAENPTVAMIEAAYRHHGLDWRYINCEVAPEALGDAVRGARAMGWAGFNCSLPHKVAVIEHLDGLG